jgi:6,7-dimethyl-8-ribityllumazine synthase
LVPLGFLARRHYNRAKETEQSRMAEARHTISAPTSDLKGARVLIVEARFYDDIADALLAGAVKALEAAGCTHERVTVPGALEIPAAVAIAFGGGRYDAAVALGCVIRGETLHFEIVSMESARGLMDLSIAKQIPLGNGIITVNDESQAWARARVEEGDKGGDAARAALAMLRLQRNASKKSPPQRNVRKKAPNKRNASKRSKSRNVRR